MPVNCEKTTALPPPAFWWLCSACTHTYTLMEMALVCVLAGPVRAGSVKVLQRASQSP